MMSFYYFLKNFSDPLIFFFLVIFFGLYRLWRRFGWTGVPLLIISPLIVLYFLSIQPVSYTVQHAMQTGCDSKAIQIQEGGTVVVLGGGISRSKIWGTNELSAKTAARLLQGIQIFQISHAKHLVLAGGNPSGGTTSESRVMAEAAKRLGVPNEALVLDEESRNTREHPWVLRRKGMTDLGHMVLVTSAIHMRRAKMDFGKYFNDLTLLSSECQNEDFSIEPSIILPSIEYLNKSLQVVHEILALVKDWLLPPLPV